MDIIKGFALNFICQAFLLLACLLLEVRLMINVSPVFNVFIPILFIVVSILITNVWYWNNKRIILSKQMNFATPEPQGDFISNQHENILSIESLKSLERRNAGTRFAMILILIFGVPILLIPNAYIMKSWIPM